MKKQVLTVLASTLAFSVLYAAETSTITITPATERESGKVLNPNEITLHRVYMDKDNDGTYESSIDIPYNGSGDLHIFQLEKLADDYNIKATTVDKDALESITYSNIAVVKADPALSIPLTPPNPPTISIANATFIEAENYIANINQGNHLWVPTITPGTSDAMAMVTAPNNNTNIDELGVDSYLTESPRLDYSVTFEQPGTYYVWIRGKSESIINAGSNNSLHVGINGIATDTSKAIHILDAANWAWSNTVMTGELATIEIPSQGIHTINVWMREDGFIFDAMVLTIDPNFQTK